MTSVNINVHIQEYKIKIQNLIFVKNINKNINFLKSSKHLMIYIYKILIKLILTVITYNFDLFYDKYI